MNTLYAKQEGNPWIITVSLLMHKPIAPENLLADEFNLPQSYWERFTDAFKTMTDTSVEGYMYDTSMTEGLVGVHTSRIGLEEMIAEAANES